MIPMAMPQLVGHDRQLVDVAHDVVADALADLGRIGVDQGGHGEAPLAEPAVVGQGLARGCRRRR